MSHIAVITDSDASISPEKAAELDIRQVPITVHFGDEVLETWEDIDDRQLFKRIDKEGRLPTTAAPSPGKFSKAYQDAIDAGAKTLICFCVSGEVSATYDAARAAIDLVSQADITVIDSRSLSLGQGFMVLAAAEAAQAGASKEEIISLAKSVGERSYYFASLSTMKYLAMSGRVGNLAAGMAHLLNIKPVLTIRDGKLEMLERVRTRRKAWTRMIELAIDTRADRPVERLAIVHVDALNAAQQFEGLLRESMECPNEIMYAELTAGLSVHSGPGFIGLSFVLKE